MGVDAIKYADNIVETYANEVTRRSDNMIKCGCGSNETTRRLVDINYIAVSMDTLACGQCAKDALGKAEEETMKKMKCLLKRMGNTKEHT